MKSVQVLFKCTPAERALIRTLAGDSGISTYLRGLVRSDARARGIALPDELLEDTRATHGGLNKSKDGAT